MGYVIHFASIRPRLQSDEGYKVNERVSAFNLQLYGRYRKGLFTIAGKTILNQNFTQSNTLGGYGVTSKNPVTGEQKYAPLRLWQVGPMSYMAVSGEAASLVVISKTLEQLSQ